MSVQIIETRDIAACHALRRTVFIEEQGVSQEEEVDGRDDAALHFLAIADGVPAGTARILLGQTTARAAGFACWQPRAARESGPS